MRNINEAERQIVIEKALQARDRAGNGKACKPENLDSAVYKDIVTNPDLLEALTGFMIVETDYAHLDWFRWLHDLGILTYPLIRSVENNYEIEEVPCDQIFNHVDAHLIDRRFYKVISEQDYQKNLMENQILNLPPAYAFIERTILRGEENWNPENFQISSDETYLARLEQAGYVKLLPKIEEASTDEVEAEKEEGKQRKSIPCKCLYKSQFVAEPFNFFNEEAYVELFEELAVQIAALEVSRGSIYAADRLAERVSSFLFTWKICDLPLRRETEKGVVFEYVPADDYYDHPEKDKILPWGTVKPYAEADIREKIRKIAPEKLKGDVSQCLEEVFKVFVDVAPDYGPDDELLNEEFGFTKQPERFHRVLGELAKLNYVERKGDLYRWKTKYRTYPARLSRYFLSHRIFEVALLEGITHFADKSHRVKTKPENTDLYQKLEQLVLDYVRKLGLGYDVYQQTAADGSVEQVTIPIDRVDEYKFETDASFVKTLFIGAGCVGERWQWELKHWGFWMPESEKELIFTYLLIARYYPVQGDMLQLGKELTEPPKRYGEVLRFFEEEGYVESEGAKVKATKKLIDVCQKVEAFGL